LRGPEAVPGGYEVKLIVGGRSYTQPFVIRKDPRLKTTQQAYQEQFNLLIDVRDEVSSTDDAINDIRRIRTQLAHVLQSSSGSSSLHDAARKLDGRLSAILHELYEPRFTGFDDQMLVYPLQLNNRIAAMQGYLQGDYAPTEQDYEVFAHLSARLRQILAVLRQITVADVPALNRQLRSRGLPEIDDSEPKSASVSP